MERREAQFVSRAPRSQLKHRLESRTIVSVNTIDRAIEIQKKHAGQRRVSDFEAITDAGGPLRDIERRGISIYVDTHNPKLTWAHTIANKNQSIFDLNFTKSNSTIFHRTYRTFNTLYKWLEYWQFYMYKYIKINKHASIFIYLLKT